jgi:hypothetical protein
MNYKILTMADIKNKEEQIVTPEDFWSPSIATTQLLQLLSKPLPTGISLNLTPLGLTPFHKKILTGSFPLSKRKAIKDIKSNIAMRAYASKFK